MTERLLSEYPVVPLLELKTRKEVEDHIDRLGKQELDMLLSKIKRAPTSNSYLEIKAAVYDLDYTIRHEKRKRLKKSQNKI